MTNRVVHISSVHPWDDERVYGRALGTLVRAGYEVHWIAVDRDGTSAGTAERAGVTLHRLPRRSLGARLVASVGLIRKAANLGAALYHIHDPELLPAALRLGRLTGARIVYDKHEYQRGRRGLKASIITAVERLLVPHVDALVVVERDDTDDLDPGDVAVTWLPNYPRLSALADVSASPDSESQIRLVYSGVVARERGLWFMMDLVEELKRRDKSVRLDLIGICHRERERSEFEVDLRRRGLETDIRRVGWTRAVPWEELMRESSRAHVGLMLMDPQYRSWSNTPTKFYEYMALGLPFVCTAYPVWTEFVERNGCGVTVNPQDTSAVADAVLGVLTDAPSPVRHGSFPFDWARVEGNLIALYRRLGVDAVGR